jgi:two-component system cell cycle response regulator
MKKKILLFIFLVITVGGIAFTVFTAYRFSTITELAIKHSADTVKDIYVYSKNKEEAIELIKNMPNIKNIEVVEKNSCSKNSKNIICERINSDKDLKIEFKSLAEFENEKYQVILETVIINILFIIFSNLLLNWLITPYLNIFEEFRKSFEKAKKGDFSKKITTKLKNEVKDIVESYNQFISQIDKNFKLIEENLRVLIPNAPVSGDRIIDVEKNMQILGDINKFKKIIELDSNTSEIYNRIIDILENKFKLENFKLYAVLNQKQEISTIYQKGKNCCEVSTPQMCRAYRTSMEVNSFRFPYVCQENFCEDCNYICIPFSKGGTFTGIVSMNFSKEEWGKHKNDIAYIESYLNESASIVEAKYTLNLMKENALTDQMTGLYNRRYLEEILDKIAAATIREKSLLGVLMVDVDYFKKVNDTYGHDAGDAVLKELAKTMVNIVRESDFVVRFGGEEFIIILQNVKDEEGILKVAEKIRETFANTKIIINGKTLTKTISIGVSVFPKHTNKIWEAIKYSDLALYEAKNTGRNRVVEFNTKLLEESNYN